MSRIIDMSTLPAPAVVEPLSFESIYAAMLADLQLRLPEWTANLESDPIVKLLQTCAYRELVIRQRVNEAAKAVMLAYATGADLDHLGVLFNVIRLEDEDDTRLRSRIQQGLAAVGAAGPAAAYRAHAMAVSANIVDVAVHSEFPGRVDVTVLAHQASDTATTDPQAIAIGAALFPGVALDAGQSPTVAPHNAPLLQSVITALSDEDVRPLTDQVVVASPTVQATAIVARLHLYRGPDPSTIVAQARASLSVKLGSLRRIGHDMTRASLIAALAVPGVQNVLLDSPSSDIVCGNADVAAATSIDISVQLITA